MAQPEAPLPPELTTDDTTTQNATESAEPSPASSTSASPSPSTEAPAPPASANPPSKLWRGASLLLAVALVFCGVLLAQQNDRIALLDNVVVSLGEELAGTRAEVAVYESRMEHVRVELSDVLIKVGLLHQFMSEDVTSAGVAVGAGTSEAEEGVASEQDSDGLLPNAPASETPGLGAIAAE